MGFGVSSGAIVAAFLLVTALTIFTLFFAVAFTIKNLTLFPLSIVTSVINVVDLACLAYYFLIRLAKSQSRVRLSRLLAVSISFIVSHALSLALLIWMQIRPQGIAETAFGQRIDTLQFAAWGLWGASTIAHAIFIPIEIVRRQQPLPDHPSMSRYILTRISESWAPPSPDLTAVINAPYFSRSNPSFVNTASTLREKDALIGSENSSDVHQSPLRTVLVLATNNRETEVNPLSPKGSGSDISVSPPISPSGDAEASQYTTRPTTPVKQRLEPIPGSQPNSPADTFKDAQPYLNASSVTEGSAGVLQTQESQAAEGDRGRTPTRIPPRFRKNVTSENSQPRSPIMDESHIHPLFRTASPLPAPTPSPTSTIIASALGGQYVASQSLSRTGSQSNPSLRRHASRPGMRQRSGSHSTPLKAETDAEETIKRTRSLNTVKPMALVETGENIPPPSPSEAGSNASVGEALVLGTRGIAM